MTSTWRCPRCGMKFLTKRPDVTRASITRCAEPGCEVRFGHARRLTERQAVTIWLASPLPTEAA